MRKTNRSGFVLTAFLLMTSLGLVSQVRPVMAQTSVFIDPSTATTSVGSIFTISAQISNVQNFQAYDIAIEYEPAHIRLLGTSADLTGTVFDGRSTFLVANDGSVAGRVRVTTTLLGAPINVASSAALLFLNFKTLLAGSSAINIASVTIVVMVNGQATAAPVTISHGTVNTPAGKTGIFFKSWGLKSNDQVLKLSQGQRTAFIVARLSNNGTADGFAQFTIRLVSRSGLLITVRSPCVAVPSQGEGVDRIAAEVSAKFKADPVPDSFVGFGVLSIASEAKVDNAGNCVSLVKPRTSEVRALVEPFIIIN